jgi:hypothetical protein
MWHVSDREEVDADFRWENTWETENLENICVHWDDDTKMNLHGTRLSGFGQIDRDEDSEEWRALVNTMMKLQVA